ncbi:MAG TPA: GEVED domain-containing protein, partial [Flavobacteriales bacterium]|nr:GEVED domain-containing protein [Flavobacteriales bacterium]
MMQDRTIQSMLTHLWCATSEPVAAKQTRVLGTILSLAVFLLMGITGMAQTITIGAGALTSGTTDNGNPIYRSSPTSAFGWSKSVELWTAADLAALPGASNITAIAFNKTTTSTIAVGRTATMNIYMKNSGATALASGTSWDAMVAGATLVYSNAAVGPADVPAVAGYWTIPLTTSIAYGGGAMEVYISWDVNGASSGLTATPGAFQWQYATTTGIQAMGTSNSVAIPGTNATWTTQLRRFNAQVTYTPGAACAGTPTPGLTQSSVASACPSTNFTLSLQNATSGSGVSYQWQRDTGSGMANFGTDAASQLVSQAVATDYQCIVTCTGAVPPSGTSNPISVGLNSFLACYCSPTFANNIEPISLVQFSDINNPSACPVGSGGAVEDFTSITGNITAGVTYPITVSGNSDGGYTNFFTVFFDFDRNGTFETSFPLGSFTGSACDLNVTGNILIPISAPAGISRMRVIKNYNASPTLPCGAYGFGQAEDYLVNVSASSACAGTPTPGNTITSNANPCSGTSFTLSLQNATLGTGVTYQWQSADDAGFTLNLTAMGTNATQVTSQTAPKYYRCTVTCPAGAPTDGTSTEVLVNVNTDLCFCAPYPVSQATVSGDEDLSNVTVGGMNNTSNCITAAGGAGSILQRYSNFVGIVAGPIQAQGDVVSFSLTQTSCGGDYGHGMQLYVDWNQDGDFLDVDEQVYNQPVQGTGTETVTGSFTVPYTALLGSTRMRAVVAEVVFPTVTNYAQTTFGWGETEDYCFTVTAGSGCAGTPTPGNTLTSNANPCSGANFTLSLQNSTPGSNTTYQWESADDAAFSVNFTALGTNPTQVTSQTTAKYYRCIVSCPTAVPTDGISTEVLVTVNTDNCACLAYPASVAVFTGDEDLSNVTVGSMNNTSDCFTVAPGAGSVLERYANYVGSVTGPTQAQGDIVSFSLTQTSCGGSYGNGMQLYVDWNQDGDFLDVDEQVYTQPAGATGDHTETGTFSVPISATLGSTRMRAVVVEGAFPDPTNYSGGGYNWGETEDYCFTVTVGSACTGTPAPGNTIASVANACSAANFTLSLQNPTSGLGVTYQWESADDAGFTVNQTNLGTASTQVTSQATAKYYRCTVTCPTFAVGVSNPILVSMAGACQCAVYCAVTNNGDGACINTVQINTLNSTSAACVANPGYTLRSETTNLSRGLTYPITVTTINDVIYGGAIVSVWFDWDNSGTFDAGEWFQPNTTGFTGTINVPVPVTANLGTTRMRVRTRGAGNPNAATDGCTATFGSGTCEDFCITIDPLPSCLPPSGLTAVANNTTSGTVTWNTTIGETYDVEVRSSGAPGSGPGGLDDSGTALAGPTFNATGLTPTTNYLAYVRTDCGTPPLSSWSAGLPFRTGVCEASVNFPGGLNDFNITPVSFADINNPSSSPSGYEDFTSVVGHVIPGQTYTLSIGRASNYSFDQFQVYINWNQDLDFNDAGESVFSSPAPPPVGGAVVVNITVPANAIPGNCTMRIRRQYDDGVLVSNYTACGNSDLGQVEDYTLNICAPVVATVEMTAVCGTSMDAEVTIINLGSGAPGSGTITYAVNGGTPVTVGAVVGLNSLSALGMVANSTDNVTISVGNGSICSLDLGTYYSNCPVTVDCNAPAETYNYCYKNNEGRTFHYVAAPGETVTLNFIQGGLGASDVVNFFDGPNAASPSLGGGNFSGNLAPADFVSSGQDMFVKITSNGTNSCFDGGQTVEWIWTVGCTPDCVSPTGDVAYLVPAVECNPPGFYLEVTLYDGGASDAAEPLFTADVVWTINGVSNPAYIVSGLGTFVPTQIGPFPLGSIVNVTFVHGTNPACNNNTGNYTQANTCPPANDLCVNAQELPINAIGGCPGAAVQGTTNFATYDNVPVTCNNGAGTIRDVWYRFNTGAISNPIQLRFTAGTAVGYSAEFYPGNAGPICLGASFGCITSAAGGVNLTLAANTDYYIRVFTNSLTGTAGTFGICVAGSSCPAPTLPTVTAITESSANIGWTGATGNYIVEYGPSSSFTTASVGGTSTTGGFIATGSSNPITITGLVANTNYRYFVRRDCGSGVYSFNTGFGLFNTLSPPPAATTILHNTCAQAAAIPDGGCPTNNVLTAEFAVTTVGTSLGVDVQLQSVDLIIPHTWRSDLEITLVAPSGQTRSLINARGGSNNNFGNNAACPTAYLRLINGGQALAGMPATDNTIGDWAPEQSFTGLTGDPNGTWKLRICDAFGADVGTLQFVRLNFVPCVGPTYTLTALPACGSGQYSIGVNISNMGSASTYAITNTANGSVVTATGTGTWNVGPFLSGTIVTLNLAHNVNALCSASTGALQFTCPPANDLCADAIAITCNSVVTGSTVASSATAGPGDCSAYFDDGTGGVWYTLPGWDGPMTASLCTGTAYDSKIAVYTGTCGSFVCVEGNDDFCGVQSEITWAGSSAEIYTIYVTGWNGNTGPFTLTTQCGTTNPVCTENGLFLEFQNDLNPGQVTWEILNQAGNLVVLSGADPVPASSIGTQALCLPDGCYRLRVLDSAGDGMTTGGYELREDGGARIIDNTNNFSTGSVSSVAGGFCLPLGTSDLIYSSCDKLDWVEYKYLVCHAIPAVAAEWIPSGANSVQDANSGYEFWIFDPNGSYSFRKFHAHNVSDGFSPASANRACRLKIHGWYNTVLTPHIPQNVKMNVRVRGRVNGVNQNFGPACTMMMNTAAAACPLARLQDDPANPSDFSCGVNRTWGGTNTGANKIVARPPQFWPAPFGGGTGVRFQFRFRIPSENICIVRPPQASPTLYLNWNTGTPLVATKTYEV